MKKCLIIGGGDTADRLSLKKYIDGSEFVICCDSGYLFAQAMGITPSLIVGDFDSADRPDTDIETVVLPCEKDDTDSFFAVKEGLARGFDCFTLIGVTGGRLDHTFAAVSILEYLETRGVPGQIIDSNTRIRVTSKTLDIMPDCRYFSVFASGHASGVCITGAKYNLQDAEIDSSYQYGVSNEPQGAPTVSVKNGKLIVMEIFE